MTQLSWLHLSDWHQKTASSPGKEDAFNRQVVLDALLTDIRERAHIDPTLAQLDCFVFSGDVAFSGQANEYDAAHRALFNPILVETGLRPSQTFIIPGNHDLDRIKILSLPPELQESFTSEEKLQEWLADDAKRQILLSPFAAYRQFVEAFNGQHQADYLTQLTWVKDGYRIALLGMNSAFLCSRNKGSDGKENDYGFLAVGETQFHHALPDFVKADVRIGVLHHPFAWLTQFDQPRVENQLCQSCDFLLRGHEHWPEVKVYEGTSGKTVIIPAGASYDKRNADDARYTNGYNFTVLDLDKGIGKVFLRRWSDKRTAWIPDIETYPQGQITFRLPSTLGKATAVQTSAIFEPESIQYKSCVLCYTSEDAAFAKRLYEDLKAHNVPCWEHQLRGGQYRENQIERAIRAQQRLIVICSQHSLVTPEIGDQVVTAMRRERESGKKKLFPIALDNFILSTDILTVADSQLDSERFQFDWIRELRAYFVPDFSQWKNKTIYQQAFTKLLKDLKS